MSRLRKSKVLTCLKIFENKHNSVPDTFRRGDEFDVFVKTLATLQRPTRNFAYNRLTGLVNARHWARCKAGAIRKTPSDDPFVERLQRPVVVLEDSKGQSVSACQFFFHPTRPQSLKQLQLQH